MWKGPLPPKRVSPARSFGDVLLPALEAAVGSPTSRADHDPFSPLVQISNELAKPTSCTRHLSRDMLFPRHQAPAPELSHGGTDPNWAKPNRRLVRSILVPDPLPCKTYAAVVMAGGPGARRADHAPGRRARGRAAPGHPRGRGNPGQGAADFAAGGRGRAAVVQQILVDAAQIRAAQALANASQSFPGRGGGRAQGGRGRDREDTQAGDAAFQVANTDTAVPADRSQ